MTNHKRTIKKPRFLISYLISFAVAFLVLLGVGIIVFNSESSKFYTRVKANAYENYCDIQDAAYNFINKDREDISELDIVWLRWLLVNHYAETGEYMEVYYDNKLIADAKQNVMLSYNTKYEDPYGGFTIDFFKFEIADKKYIQYFDTPEIKAYQTVIDNSEYEGLYEGFNSQPWIDFECSEFYVDFDTGRFIPVVITFGKDIFDETVQGYEVKITPDPKDIEGFTLVKIDSNSEDSAYGTVCGLEGPINGSLYDATYGAHKAENYFKETGFITKEFVDVYRNQIIIAAVVLLACALIIALIPATIRYNINKRNYEIYEYRLKTTNAMAHDLKTPLAAIAGYAESLSYHIGTDKQEYFADKIEDKVGQMTSMINDILEFSKSEVLSGDVVKADTDIGSLIAEIISDNEHTINNRDLRVNYDKKEVIVNTDKELFKQALSNLISNAVLHCKEGTAVDISCDKDQIKITNVIDEKIDDIKSIREPFVKGSESRGNSGSGLGLAIADNNLSMLKYKLDLKIDADKFIAVVKMK